MATIKDITTLCKSGKIQEGYETALADWNNDPDNVWTQREVGWALYYLIKEDVEKGNCDAICEHLGKLTELTQLDMSNDSLIFDNVLWKLSEFVKTVPADNPIPVSKLFSIVQNWRFAPSRPYSYFMQNCLKFDAWDQMTAFIEWWNLDSLLADDFQQFKMENGKTVMALAERVLITYSKALLKLKDQEKIGQFIPKLEAFAETYPEMLYLGYFCGKLLIAQGASQDETLKKLIPFVGKKVNEFWAWQVMSEIYRDDIEKRMACLLRAVHCKTQESFLGKIRIALAELYIIKNDYARAKHHIDKVSSCYLEQGWKIPSQIRIWAGQDWIHTTKSDHTDPMDYRTLTDDILYSDAKNCTAIVTYVDVQTKRMTIIYGLKKKLTVKYAYLHIRPTEGMFLNIKYVSERDNIRVVMATPYSGSMDVPYLKEIYGMIDKKQENPFAFIKGATDKYFVTPNIVSKYNLHGGESVNAIVAYDFNKKKSEWNWICISINK